MEHIRELQDQRQNNKTKQTQEWPYLVEWALSSCQPEASIRWVVQMINLPDVKVRILTMKSSGVRKIHAMLILGVSGWFPTRSSIDSSIPLILIHGKARVILDSAQVVDGVMCPNSFA